MTNIELVECFFLVSNDIPGLVFIALYLFSFLGYSKGMEEDPNSLDEMDEDLEFRTVDRTSTQQLEGS